MKVKEAAGWRRRFRGMLWAQEDSRRRDWVEQRSLILVLAVCFISALAWSTEGTKSPLGTSNVSAGEVRLFAQAGSQAADIAPDKQDTYRDVTEKLEALKREEKDLVRRGYRENHPLLQAVRSQLRELSTQKAELEHPSLNPSPVEKSELQATSAPEAKLVGPGSGQEVAQAAPVPSGISGRNMDSLDDKQKLGVGDRVTFRVVEDQEEPKPLTVTDAGELDVPELGLVTAAGKTCRQLAFEIKPKLEQTTYYHATVIIGIDLLNKTMSGRRAYVSGQVLKTGPQEIPAGETWTVAKAIMRAGGFTDFADQKHVRLVRAASKGTPGKTFVLNVGEVLEKGRTDLDLSVEPEDLIYVPARAVNF